MPTVAPLADMEVAWPSARHVTRAHRLAARLMQRSLDRRLAGGANPLRSGLLTARTSQLTSWDYRQRVAGEIEEAVSAAASPSRWTAAISPSRAAVEDARTDLAALVASLRDPYPVYARGIAMCVVLLRDGAGPLYNPRLAATARDATHAARDALAGH